jgi:signal transduction histidine kinase
MNFTHIQSEDFNEILNMLENGSDRITRTIDEIIEMSKLRSGNYELNVGPILLEKEVLQPLVTNYRDTAQKKGIKLIFEKETLEDKIWRDKFMVYQIFREIIDNAIKFTDSGTVSIKQFLNAEEKLSVSIKDTGVGISIGYMEHLFEPFTQEQSGYTRKYEGNGLALALVKKYAELNNLTIKINSEKNVGSEFIVIFN